MKREPESGLPDLPVAFVSRLADRRPARFDTISLCKYNGFEVSKSLLRFPKLRRFDVMVESN